MQKLELTVQRFYAINYNPDDWDEFDDEKIQIIPYYALATEQRLRVDEEIRTTLEMGRDICNEDHEPRQFYRMAMQS